MGVAFHESYACPCVRVQMLPKLQRKQACSLLSSACYSSSQNLKPTT